MSGPDWQAEALRLRNVLGMPLKQIARTVGKGEHTVSAFLSHHAKARNPRTALGGMYAPIEKPVTLPAVSISAPVGEERAAIRFAPKSSVTPLSPGAARIREIPQRMIRSGRIAEPGVIEEMVH